jgi:outer membrane protein assembly factor BamA
MWSYRGAGRFANLAVMWIAATLLFAASGLATQAKPADGQQFHPRNIVFQGQSEYSDAEMLAAAGLVKGQALTAEEMNEHSKMLLDTGAFEDISYSFNGQDLIFTVKLSDRMYPVRIDNLPLALGKDLDSSLHARAPLYHGRVPNEGGLLESVRKGLEAELAMRGVDATVIATPTTDPRLGTVSAITFSESSPRVWVGDVRLAGAEDALTGGARAAVEKIHGAPYSSEGSRSQIETELNNYYRNEGFLQAEAHAEPGLATGKATPLDKDDAGVRVPFTVQIEEGPLYKLGSITLEPGMMVTQAAFDAQAKVHPGDVARQNRLHEEWEYLARQYRNLGLMKARITATATFHGGEGKVDYAVSATPGPTYTMGTLTVQNSSPELQAAIKRAWKLSPGEVFNEGSILSFTATTGVNPALEEFFKTVNLRYALKINDDAKTVDVFLRFEKKP